MKEKKIIVCPNPDCLQKLMIPDTKKTLRVNCSKCGDSFLYDPDDYMNEILLLEKEGLDFYKYFRYNEALEMFNKALDTYRLNNVEEDIGYAILLNHIANVYADQYKIYKAYELTKYSLDIYLKIFKEDDLMLAGMYANMMTSSCDINKFEEAIDYGNKAINIFTREFGENCIQMGDLYADLSITYRKIGNLSEAEDLIIKALDIQQKYYGRLHPRVAASFDKYGKVLSLKGELENSIDNHIKAIDISKTLFGDYHITLYNSYNSVAGVYVQQKNYKIAFDIMDKVKIIIDKEFGEKSYQNLEYCKNMTSLYLCLNKIEEAEHTAQTAKKIHYQLFGIDTPGSEGLYCLIGGIKQEKTNYNEAMENFEKALEISLKYHGELNFITAQCYFNLGRLQMILGNISECKRFLKKAHDISLKVVGPNNSFAKILTDLKNELGF